MREEPAVALLNCLSVGGTGLVDLRGMLGAEELKVDFEAVESSNPGKAGRSSRGRLSRGKRLRPWLGLQYVSFLVARLEERDASESNEMDSRLLEAEAIVESTRGV
jgi:hypothetical protein